MSVKTALAKLSVAAAGGALLGGGAVHVAEPAKAAVDYKTVKSIKTERPVHTKLIKRVIAKPRMVKRIRRVVEEEQTPCCQQQMALVPLPVAQPLPPLPPMLAQAVPAPAAAPAPPAPPSAFGVSRNNDWRGGYRSGTRALDDRRYEDAVRAFDAAIDSKDNRADGALYWKAYALNKLGKRTEALAALDRLDKEHGNSAWLGDAKALLESIARSFGYHYGFARKVRVNTISQSPTVTTAGSGVTGFDVFFDYAEKMSPLGNASAEDCADFCCMLFSDYTRMVTMQNLFHDGGFSFTGVTASVIEQMEK